MVVTKKKTPPRKVPTRDERYMGLAFILSGFSKDPSTQHGAIIVTSDNVPLGSGYNGPPRQYVDSDMDWSRPGKYKDIIHAEINAIKRSPPHLLEGATIYVTGKPCSGCMIDIVDAGIRRVIYFPYRSTDPNSMMNNKDIFTDTDEIAKNGKVVMEPFKGNLNWLKDWMVRLETLGIFE